ncbi:MAG: thiamine phosphate synthase [Oliverpabstia sp.]
MENNSLFETVIAVTNRHLCDRPFTEQLERVCSHHPRALILREKDLPEKEYELLAKNVLEICRNYDVPCILHTYTDVARRLGCSRIHLPLPLLRTNASSLGNFSLIGTSVHSLEEAVEAEKLGASYLTAGHIYVTDCKKGLPPRGTGFLREVCLQVSVPVYAIGGIHLDKTKMKEVIGCGAAGGCIMSGMMRL